MSTIQELHEPVIAAVKAQEPPKPVEKKEPGKNINESKNTQDTTTAHHPDEIKKLVEQAEATNISFNVDLDEGRTMVKIIDSDSNEVIKTIPSKEMLEVMVRIEEMIGKLLDESA